MSDQNINVNVKATTAGLQSGMDEANAIVGRSTAYMRENIQGLGSLVERIKVPFAALAAAMAGGEIVRGIKDAIQHVDTLAVSMEHASATTGLSTEELSKLRYAAEQSAIPFDAVTKGMQKLALSMEMSGTKSSLAAGAYKALGIATTDAEGHLRPMNDVLLEVADKFHGMKDGSTKTALAMNLFGRAGAQLIPLLDEGSAGLQKWGDEAKRTGDVIGSQTDTRLAEYHAAMVRVKGVVEGMTIQAVTQLAPALTDIAQGFVAGSKDGGAFHVIITGVADAARLVAGSILMAVGSLRALNTVMSADLTKAGAFTAAWKKASEQMDQMGISVRRAFGTPLPTDPPVPVGPIPAGGGGHGTVPVIPHGGGGPKSVHLPHAPDIGAAILKIWHKQQEVQDTELKATAAHDVAMLGLKRDAIEAERQLGQISDTTALRQERTLLDQEYQAKKTGLQQQLALYHDDVVKQAQVKAQLQALDDQHNLAMQKNSEATTLAIKNQWLSVFAIATQTLQTAVNGLIQGTQTIQQIMAGLYRSLLAQLVSFEAKRLANHLATELAMTQATAAGTTARSAFSWKAAIESVAATVWAGLKNIAVHAAEAAAAAWASIANIPYVGPFLAPAAAAATLAAVLALGGKIASASGGYDIPAGLNPVTQLHASEMVLPAKYADVIRGMANANGSGAAGGGGGGGGDIHLHVHAVDAQSVKRLFMENQDALAGAVRGAFRNGHFASV